MKVFEVLEGGMPVRTSNASRTSNMPNAGDRPRDPRVIRNMPNAAADDVNPVEDYINALKDPNADPEWLEVLRKMANAYTGQDLDEGIFDFISSGADASGLNNIGNMIGKTQTDDITLARKAKELLDQGMPQQEIIRALQQEFGVNPQYARSALRMAEVDGLIPEGRLKSKSYKKSYKAAKASGRRRMKSLRDSVNENAQANAMLSKVDTVLQGTGFARKGFEIVKAPQQGMVRGSITDEALAMVKNMLAKAKAMGATEGPAINPNPTVNPADIDDKEFEGMYETATAGGTSAGAIATVSNPSVTRNAKKPKKHKGVAPNALDSGANLMSGQVLKR